MGEGKILRRVGVNTLPINASIKKYIAIEKILSGNFVTIENSSVKNATSKTNINGVAQNSASIGASVNVYTI